MTRTFAETLALRRHWMGWTLTETAEYLGVHTETYRRWERGHATPHQLLGAGAVALLDAVSLKRAEEIFTELSTANSHSCCPSYPQGDRVPIDPNTRSSTGDH
jgi:transcriptional regulator with XRE-family HTH domain